MTIFDWINQILVDKKPWESFDESEQKAFSPFIINRWLSMDKDFIEVINYFQKYAIGTLKSREVYKYTQENSPLKRNVNLDEIGNSAVYLISEMSKSVTGEIHYVDCGFNIVGMPKP